MQSDSISGQSLTPDREKASNSLESISSSMEVTLTIFIKLWEPSFRLSGVYFLKSSKLSCRINCPNLSLLISSSH